MTENSIKYKRECVITNCVGKDSSKILSFRFPLNNRKLLRIWCHNSRIEVESIKNSTHICSRHFEADFVGSRKLKYGAIPTLLLGHNNVKYYDCKPRERTCIRKCKVPLCVSTSPPYVLYLVPKDKRAEWIKICKMPESVNQLKHMHICGKHFTSDMITKKTMHSHAYPCRNLPICEGYDEEDDNIDEDVNDEDDNDVNSASDILDSDMKNETPTLVDPIGNNQTQLHQNGDVQPDTNCSNCAKLMRLYEFHKLKCQRMERQIQELEQAQKAEAEEHELQRERLANEIDTWEGWINANCSEFLQH